MRSFHNQTGKGGGDSPLPLKGEGSLAEESMAKPDIYVPWGVVAQEDGYHPRARIWVQRVLFDDGMGQFIADPDGAIVELTEWTTLQVNRIRTGESTMTITIANPRDRYCRFAAPRTKWDISDPGTDDQGVMIGKYYDQLVRLFYPYMNPINPEKLSGNIDYQANAYRAQQWLYGVTANASKEAQAGFYRDAESETGLGRMQRIFCDILGEDGKVYAGFSGMISSISENWSVDGEPSLTISCRDMLRMFSITEILVAAPLWSLLIPESLDVQGRYNLSIAANWLAGQPIDAIVYLVTKIIQDSFCWPNAKQRYEDDKNKSASTANQESQAKAGDDKLAAFIDNPKNFWFQHSLWHLPATFGTLDDKSNEQVKKYTDCNLHEFYGMSPIRRRFQSKDGGQDWIEAPGGIQADWTLSDLTAQLCIDTYFREAQETAGYQYAIRAEFNILQATKIRGDAICRHAAEMLWCDWYADPNGNIVFQMPKFNNVPCSIATEPRLDDAKLKLPGQVPTNMTFQPEASDLWDFSPAPDVMPMRGHSYNYVIIDPSMKGWNITESEEGIVTYAIVPFAPGVELNFTEIFSATNQNGTADDPAMQARYGIRMEETSKIFCEALTMKDEAEAKPVRNAVAAHFMAMKNGASISGSVRLVNRPDLDIARTVLLFERQKIAYLDTINYTIPKGKSMTMNLTLQYVHDIGSAIPNPWVDVRERVRKLS